MSQTTSLSPAPAPTLAISNIAGSPLSTAVGVVNALGAVLASVASNPGALPSTGLGWAGFGASILSSLLMALSRA